ncbi:MAG: hypothetical protein NZ529_09400 [Cytophagaceae bacterium]|nr:hypothetical protein [Cytophagaceae bacterium]MDW8457000.1 hypothetical protein [Cytophagaceae bacterium]
MYSVIFNITFLSISLSFVFSANAQSTLNKHIEEVRKIIKTDATGIVRGYDFNTTVDKIKSSEDAVLIMENDHTLMYKLDINAKEYCDIIYQYDKTTKKLKSISLIFLEERDAKPEETLIDDFQNYFTERFGNFKVNEKDDEVWTSKDGTFSIELSDETRPGDDLIEIEIEITKIK